MIGFAHFDGLPVLDKQNAVGLLCQPVVMGDHHKRNTSFSVHLPHQTKNFFT